MPTNFALNNCCQQVETNILATTADDRSITLFDVRASSPMRSVLPLTLHACLGLTMPACSKVVLAMRSNRLCWNPMEAFNFTVANEDHNLYTFDMRRLDHAINVHKDHVSAGALAAWLV